MNTTAILEHIRSLHLDIENAQVELQTQLPIVVSDPHHRAVRDRFLADRVLAIRNKSAMLLDLYRGSELSALTKASSARHSKASTTTTTLKSAPAPTGPSASTVVVEDHATAATDGLNALSSFYQRIQELREHHRRKGNPNVPIRDLLHLPDDNDRPSVVSSSLQLIQPPIPFTGEERWGTTLDLNIQYSEYCALLLESLESEREDASSTVPTPPRYRTFLAQSLHDIARHNHPLYENDQVRSRLTCFVQSLITYFEEYHRKLFPLDDITVDQARKMYNVGATEDEHRQHSSGKLSEDDSEQKVVLRSACELLSFWLSFNEERMKRTLLLIDHRSSADWRELESEAQRDQENFRSEMIRAAEQAARSLYMRDASIRLARNSYLTTQQLNAIYNRPIVTLDEAGNPSMVKDEQRMEEEHVQNAIKKKLAVKANTPMGWDGQPIPTWLSKLHGLTVPFFCEICATTYYGPLVFERHFKEARHVHRLALAKIPYSKHFQGVTTLAEARSLWEEIQRSTAQGMWHAEEEEFEDEEGNVLNRKTLEAMKRQRIH